MARLGLRRFGVVLMSALMLATSFSHVTAPPAAAAVFNVIPADSNLDPQDTFDAGQDVYAYVTSNLGGGRVCLDGHTGGESWCTDIPPFAADFYPIVSHGVLEAGTHHLTGFPTADNDTSSPVRSVDFQVLPCPGACPHAMDAVMSGLYKARAGAMVDGTAWSCEMTNHWKTDSTKQVGVRSIVKGASTTDHTSSENYGIIAGNFLTFAQGWFGALVIDTPSEEAALALLKEISCATKTAYKSIQADPPNSDYLTVDVPTPLSLPTYPDATYESVIDSFNTVYALNTATLHGYERYLGAVADGSDVGIHRQMSNIGLLAGQTAGDMRDLATRLRAYATSISADADARSVLTSADRDAIAAIQDRVRTSGFTGDEKAALAGFSYSDQQIEEIRQTFLAEDVSHAKIDTPASSILSGLAADLDTNAPFWDEFAAAARVVATNSNQAPVPSFTAIPSSGDAPLDVTFSSTSTDADNDPLTASWDFGDGTTGTGAVVHHVYAAGSYTATLTVSDGPATASSNTSIVASAAGANHKPVASFTAVPSTGAAPLDVTFTDTSTDADNDPLIASWDFGDGSTDSGSPVHHVYAAGSYTASLTVSDGTTTSSTTLPVTVTPVVATNHPPVAVDDSLATTSNGLQLVSVLSNDSDADGDSLTVTSNSTAAHGTADCSYGSFCTYQPNFGYVGPDSFDYTVSDGQGGTDVGTVNITVAGNHPPVAVDDSVITRRNAPQTRSVNVVANDSDPDADPLTVASHTDAAHGTADCPTGGLFCSYTPLADYVGPDSFDYTIDDGQGGQATGTVNVTVGENRAPLAVDDTATPFEGESIDINVLANDSDPDGDAFEISTSTAAGHGTATCSSAACTYVADTGYAGPDGFDYTIGDGDAISVGHVAITVKPASNFAPFTTVHGTDLVQAGFGGMRDNGTGSLTVGGVSGAVTKAYLFWQGPANPTDPIPSSTVSFAGHSVTGTNIGVSSDNCWGYSSSQAFRADVTSLVSGNGSYALDGFNSEVDSNGASLIVFYDDGNAANNRDVSVFDGNDSNVGHPYDAVGWHANLPGIEYAGGTARMTLHVSDGQTYPKSALVLNSLTLSPDDAPIFQGDSVPFGSFDSEGHLWDVTPFDITSALSSGTNNLKLTMDGLYGDCVSLVVAVVDLPAKAGSNQPPVGVADSYTTPRDTALVVPVLTGVLANDTDADTSTTLTAAKVADPAHGTLTLAANGSFTYTPALDYVGSDSFTYNVSDGLATVGPVTVSITVTAVNHPPVGTADSYTGPQDAVLSVNATLGVLANDRDADGNALTAAKNSDPTHGSVVLNADGSFAYTPNAGFVGPDSFTYKVSDGIATSAAITVLLTITHVNHAPVGVADSYSGPQDTNLVVASPGILANDTDTDGDTLTATKASDPAHGSVTVNANGSLTYTPNAGYVGPDSFTYTAGDGLASSAATTVSLTITHANHPPTLAVVNDQNIPEMVLFNSLTLSGSDPDGDSLTYSLVSGPSGLAVNATSGVVSWTPTEAQGPGDYQVTVRVADPDGLHADRSFTIHVTEVNLAPSLDAITDRTVNPGDLVSLTAVGHDPDLPANTLTYSLVSGPSGATVNPASGAFAWTSSSTLGDYSVTIAVSDGIATASRSFTIHVVRDATSLTLGGDTSGQYSDHATITATLKVGTAGVSGASVSISLGGVSQAAATNTSGVASATFAIPGPAGSLATAASFAGTASKAPSSVSGTFTVNREESTVVYSGDAIGLAGATLHLAATFTDSAAAGFAGSNAETGPGKTIGDITKARIAFAVYNAATCLTGSPITTLSAFVTDTGTTGDGIGTAMVTWSSSSEGSLCVVPSLVGAAGTGPNGYYTAPPAEAAGLAVFIDTAGKVTGGGWVAIGTGRGNFGFNATSNGTKVKGNLVFIERTTYLGKKAMLIIKSNAIDSLRTSGSVFPITATLSGKATFKYISSVDGSTLFESGNATFSATVVDTNFKSPPTGDSFAIRVLDKTGAVLVDLATTPLGGGNIVAHLQ